MASEAGRNLVRVRAARRRPRVHHDIDRRQRMLAGAEGLADQSLEPIAPDRIAGRPYADGGAESRMGEPVWSGDHEEESV